MVGTLTVSLLVWITAAKIVFDCILNFYRLIVVVAELFTLGGASS